MGTLTSRKIGNIGEEIENKDDRERDGSVTFQRLNRILEEYMQGERLVRLKDLRVHTLTSLRTLKAFCGRC